MNNASTILLATILTMIIKIIINKITKVHGNNRDKRGAVVELDT
jgi:hypothetical protein